VNIRPTPLGRRFLNDLQTLFLPAGAQKVAVPTQPVVMERLVP